MHDSTLQYAVLKYAPSLVSGESINLGILVASESEPLVDFIATKKFARVKEFDDSLDIEMLKIFLQGIKGEVETTLENYNQLFDISNYTQYYCNEYHFSRTIELPYKQFDSALKELKRIYLPQDFPKNQRTSHKEELQFMAKILETNHVDFRRNVKELGSYSDQITYDFRVENYGIKLFWLKGKELNRLMTSVKAWAWNCQNSPQGIKTVIIYNYDIEESHSTEMQTFLNIFKASSKYIYSWTDGMNWLKTLSDY